jgi:hypothetical protein
MDTCSSFATHSALLGVARYLEPDHCLWRDGSLVDMDHGKLCSEKEEELPFWKVAQREPSLGTTTKV